MTDNDNIKKVIYPDSPLGENNIITKIKRIRRVPRIYLFVKIIKRSSR